MQLSGWLLLPLALLALYVMWRMFALIDYFLWKARPAIRTEAVSPDKERERSPLPSPYSSSSLPD